MTLFSGLEEFQGLPSGPDHTNALLSLYFNVFIAPPKTFKALIIYGKILL